MKHTTRINQRALVPFSFVPISLFHEDIRDLGRIRLIPAYFVLGARLFGYATEKSNGKKYAWPSFAELEKCGEFRSTISAGLKAWEAAGVLRRASKAEVAKLRIPAGRRTVYEVIAPTVGDDQGCCRVENWILEHADLSAGAKCIAILKGRSPERSFQTVKWFAKNLRVGVRQIKIWRAELVKKGIAEADRKSRGSHSSAIYRTLAPPATVGRRSPQLSAGDPPDVRQAIPPTFGGRSPVLDQALDQKLDHLYLSERQEREAVQQTKNRNEKKPSSFRAAPPRNSGQAPREGTTPLPAKFVLTTEREVYALEAHVEPQFTFKEFVSRAKGDGWYKADWDEAWHAWVHGARRMAKEGYDYPYWMHNDEEKARVARYRLITDRLPKVQAPADLLLLLREVGVKFERTDDGKLNVRIRPKDWTVGLRAALDVHRTGMLALLDVEGWPSATHWSGGRASAIGFGVEEYLYAAAEVKERTQVENAAKAEPVIASIASYAPAPEPAAVTPEQEAEWAANRAKFAEIISDSMAAMGDRLLGGDRHIPTPKVAASRAEEILDKLVSLGVKKFTEGPDGGLTWRFPVGTTNPGADFHREAREHNDEIRRLARERGLCRVG